MHELYKTTEKYENSTIPNSVNILNNNKMKKIDEKHIRDSTLNKADNEEMLFILRAQDISAPKTIIFWIAENIYNCSDDKLRGAFECALKMKTNAVRKSPD